MDFRAILEIAQVLRLVDRTKYLHKSMVEPIEVCPQHGHVRLVAHASARINFFVASWISISLDTAAGMAGVLDEITLTSEI